MIKAFIFDIGNVLLPFDFSVALRKLNGTSGVDSLAQRIEPVKRACESGRIGRAEFLKRIRCVLQYEGGEAELVAAWEDIFTENGPMSDLVRALHPRHPLYLLSNTSGLHLDYVSRVYPVFNCFSGGVYSYKAKCMKPDRLIYEIALRQFGVEPDETVFIDDMQPNVDAALELGFRAIRYDLNRHQDLIRQLRGLGVSVS